MWDQFLVPNHQQVERKLSHHQATRQLQRKLKKKGEYPIFQLNFVDLGHQIWKFIAY